MTTETESILDLTTEVAPTKKFTIDGTEYELYSTDNLSPRQEAVVTGTFSRFQKVYRLLEKARSDEAAEREATKLRALRETLIKTMTTAPTDVVEGLSPTAQGKLLEAIQNEIVLASGGDAEDDDDGASDDDE